MKLIDKQDNVEIMVIIEFLQAPSQFNLFSMTSFQFGQLYKLTVTSYAYSSCLILHVVKNAGKRMFFLIYFLIIKVVVILSATD